ncbi:hypothetical protein CM19_00730 [Candidatus Acidianus copahuensis]|uniref:ChsH2 rubredoxin-like zinc ribbon domain-containing protein n=1 Tax=Candidatus Acidianus copahuensis TaxID=1160895 RepID=A0A031LVM2_9CREN|nr:zinc ribbon domain-containing protein [Candidatus Acidianus copahuensis]EZQ11524.1 hypothetical protein CM19_00730 [Candidatus Acidianus copahuensis]
MKLSEIYSKYEEVLSKGNIPYIRCEDCGYVFFYPRHLCPKCNSSKLEILVSTGRGKVYASTKVFRKNEVIGIYGIVELTEGFRVYCNFKSDVEIGDEVMMSSIKVGDKYKLLAEKVK